MQDGSSNGEGSPNQLPDVDEPLELLGQSDEVDMGDNVGGSGLNSVGAKAEIEASGLNSPRDGGGFWDNGLDSIGANVDDDIGGSGVN